MKKRLGALLLALALVLSMAPNSMTVRAEAAEQPRLMYRPMEHDGSTDTWYEATAYGPWGLDEIGLVPGNNIYFRLYYGTSGSAAPLTGGTLKSSNEKVIQISSTTDWSQDGAPYYVMDCVGFGTATITYTDGATSYTTSMTITLPTWSALYTRQERKEEYYVKRVEYDLDTGITLWMLKDGGFTAQEVSTLSVTLGGSTYSGLTAEKVARGDGNYDVKVTIPAGLPLRVGSGYGMEICYGTDGRRGIGFRVKEKPALMFRWMNRDNDRNWYERTDEDPQYLSDFELAPNEGTNFRLYYGTRDSYVPLTGGTLTSSDPDVIDVEQIEGEATDGKPFYRIDSEWFGSATLTWTDGSVTYTANMEVVLPWAGFYSAQNRSQATYLSEGEYDADTGMTLWFMRENGLSTAQASNLSVTLDEETYPGLTAEAVDRGDGTYDIKVTVPAGLSLRVGYHYWLELSGGFGERGFDLTVKEKPGLMFRHLVYQNNILVEETDEPPRPMDRMSFAPQSSNSFRLYYGTSDSYVALTGGTLTSSDSGVLSVEKTNQNSADGQPYFRSAGIAFGPATLTYTDGTVTYTITADVTLPTWPTFYSGQEWKEENYIAGNLVYDPDKGTTLWYLQEGGFRAEELTGLAVQLDEKTVSGITAVKVARPDGNYDVKVTMKAGLALEEGRYYSLKVILKNGWSSNSIKVKEKPGLMYSVLRRDNGVWQEETDDYGNLRVWPLSNLGLTPDSGTYIRLYYGTSDSYVPLTGGTLTSSDPGVLRTGALDGAADAFYIGGEEFGSVTLTWTNGTDTYKVGMAVTIPDSPAYYTSQKRSEATYVNGPIVYDPDESITLWLMREGGFAASAVQNMEITLDNETISGLTAVKVDRGDGTYDIKVTIPAGLTLQRDYYYDLIFRHNNGTRYHSLKLKEEPGLMYCEMWYDGSEWKLATYNNGEPALEYLDGEYTPGYGGGFWKLYYGTPDSYVELPMDGTLTSSNQRVVGVYNQTYGPNDEPIAFHVRVEDFGTATLTYKVSGKTYTAQVTGRLPRSMVYYWTRERSEKNFVGPDMYQYDPVNGSTLWVLEEGGFSKENAEAATCIIENVPGDWVTITPVLRDDGRYDLRVDVKPGLEIDSAGGVSLFTQVPNYGGTNTWLHTKRGSSEYKIKEAQVKDAQGQPVAQNAPLPESKVDVEIKLENTGSVQVETDYVIVAVYDDDGRMIGVEFKEIQVAQDGSLSVGVEVDNTNGDISWLTAFLMPGAGEPVPLGNSINIGK